MSVIRQAESLSTCHVGYSHLQHNSNQFFLCIQLSSTARKCLWSAMMPAVVLPCWLHPHNHVPAACFDRDLATDFDCLASSISFSGILKINLKVSNLMK